MKDIKILIPYNGATYTPEEWAKQGDTTVATSVVVITEHTSIEIAKKPLKGNCTYDEAQKAAAEYGDGCRNATRHEGVDIYDARFAGLDVAMLLIGGEPVTGRYWTCEADTNPEYNSGSAFYYCGGIGGVYTSGKYNALGVRPVSAFPRK